MDSHFILLNYLSVLILVIACLIALKLVESEKTEKDKSNALPGC